MTAVKNAIALDYKTCRKTNDSAFQLDCALLRASEDTEREDYLFASPNGPAEGSVNKIKVIKRVMFGRCGNDLLRAKVLRLEARRSSVTTSTN